MKTTLTLTKPYTWAAPRVDVWLNQGVSRP